MLELQQHSFEMTTPITKVEQATSHPSLWDRVSTWVSENKAVAYTIAGTVVIITAGGVVYYLSDSQKKSLAASEKKKSKKERRKEKKEKEEAAAQEKAGAGIKLKDEEAGTMRQEAAARCFPVLMMAQQRSVPKNPKPPRLKLRMSCRTSAHLLSIPFRKRYVRGLPCR